MDRWDYITVGVIGIATLVFVLTKVFGKSKKNTLVLQTPNTDPQTLTGEVLQGGIDVLLLYATQTGTAEEFVYQLSADLRRLGLSTMICDVQDYDSAELLELTEVESPPLLTFLVSTYGEGDPPDSALNLSEDLQHLVQAEAEPFKGMQYAVFGLGNRTYKDFNSFGKELFKNLQLLGATPILDIGLGDDNENIEADFLNWKDELLPSMCSVLGKDLTASNVSFRLYHLIDDYNHDKIFSGEPKLWNSFAKQKCPFSQNNPYLAQVNVRREMFSDPNRSCLHFEFDLGNSKLRYSAGDHMGVFPTNNSAKVEELAKRVGADLDQVFCLKAKDRAVKKVYPFPCPTTYRVAFTHYVDINCSPSLSLLQDLIPCASDDEEKTRLASMVAKDNREVFFKYAKAEQRDILQVMKDFPSVKIAPDHLLELLPRLQPRLYSISSSQRVNKKSVHATVAVVRDKLARGATFEGVATTYLERIDIATTKVPIFVRHSTFSLPMKKNHPIIMIGPGTGIAPFRGFLQEREYLMGQDKVLGEALLLFGCQKESQHYLYREELEEYVEKGVLNHLFTAFSRDQDEKRYVQHLIAENSALLYNLIVEKHGFIYICGDGKHMAPDVRAALCTMYRQEGAKTEAQAKDWLDQLEMRRHLMQDVW
eukprot:m.37722 g.37722  ORF g.37722 m.37722 type:complete len:650 (+) comp10122_c0_seq3:116-2065(+)